MYPDRRSVPSPDLIQNEAIESLDYIKLPLVWSGGGESLIYTATSPTSCYTCSC